MSTPSNMTMATCIDLLGLRSRYRISDRASNNVCPVCGNPRDPRKKKLNINFQKGTFRCNKCDFSGGILDFWAYHRGIQKKDASKDFWKTYNEVYGDGRKREGVKTPPPRPVIVEEDPLDLDHIDKVYREFLNMLYLSKEHRENLLNRGLSEKAIENGLYRSIPLTAVKAMPARLLEKGYELSTVPGFFKEDGEWRFLRYGDGFLIPSVDIFGRICALQLRRDSSANGARYLTVSTDGYEGGTKGTAAPSFNPGRRSLNELIITEGALKGNIIADITGYPVLSVLGVNSTGSLPQILKELRKRGLRSIKVAFDMDYIGNEHVEEACNKLEKMMYRLGFRYSRIVWDPGKQEDGELLYKGLDDYLSAKAR